MPRTWALTFCRIVLAAVLFASTPPPAVAQVPVSADALGDPLPADGILRFGTVRFRTSASNSRILFAGNFRVLTTCLEMVVEVFEWPSGISKRHMLGERESIVAIGVTPDGTRCLLASVKGGLIVLDIASGTHLASFRPAGYLTNALAVSPDGGSVACAGDDGRIHVRAIVDGVELRKTAASGHPLVALVWKKNVLASLDSEGRVQTWAENVPEPATNFQAPAGSQLFVVSSEGTRVFLAGGRGKVTCSGLADGSPKIELGAGGEEIRTLALSADDKRLAAGYREGTVRSWDVESGKELFCVIASTGWVNSVGYAPDGKSLLCAGDDRTIRVFDSSTGADLLPSPGHSDQIDCLALSSDGAKLATGSADRTVALWDASTGKRLAASDRLGGPVAALAWAPDASAIVAAAGRELVLLDTKNGLHGRVLATGAGRLRAVAWLSGGAGILAGGTDTRVRQFGEVDGGILREFTGHESMIRGLAVAPDGSRFASAGADLKAALWSTATGKPAWLDAHPQSVTCATFSRDGRFLATGCADAIVRIWEAETGRAAGTIQGFDGEITGLAWSQDGKRIAASAAGNSVRVCEAPGGRELGIYRGCGGRAAGVSWSPDDRRIYSATEDTTALAWNLRR